MGLLVTLKMRAAGRWGHYEPRQTILGGKGIMFALRWPLVGFCSGFALLFSSHCLSRVLGCFCFGIFGNSTKAMQVACWDVAQVAIGRVYENRRQVPSVSALGD